MIGSVLGPLRLLTPYLADSHRLLSHDCPHLAIEFLPPLIFRPSYNGSARFDLRVTVEPLLARHRNERSEEGGGQTRVKDGLYVDHGGSGPFH